jgi:hypothetical protein
MARPPRGGPPCIARQRSRLIAVQRFFANHTKWQLTHSAFRSILNCQTAINRFGGFVVRLRVSCEGLPATVGQNFLWAQNLIKTPSSHAQRSMQSNCSTTEQVA